MIYILLSAVLFTIILAYNSIMTIIYCAKLGETVEGTEDFHYYNHLSDKYAENVRPSMYICSCLYLFYFIGEWVL